MLVDEPHTSTLIPSEVMKVHPKEDDPMETVDFVDGAGVYRHFMPSSHLSPIILDGPPVPTLSPKTIYCSCCPGMELEWDKFSMVHDVEAELQCHSLPYGLGEYDFKLAAQD